MSIIREFKNVRKRIYTTIIKSLIMYGCETTKMNERNKSKIDIFEMRVLRKIYEGNEVDGLWMRQRRRNKELM